MIISKRISGIRIIMLLLMSAAWLYCSGQTDKNATKLQMLKDKVTRAETKVAAIGKKLHIADSLITTGEIRIEEAEADFDILEEARVQAEKDYRTKMKELSKQAKSKDEAVAEKAAADIKALDTWYAAETKRFENETKLLTKKATKADADIAKGTELKKNATADLKEAQKVLDEANQNYNATLNASGTQ